MTKLLVSVMNVEEAVCVLEAEADIVDLKNPIGGALGALPADTVLEIVNAIKGRRQISATIGDIPMIASEIVHAVKKMAAVGVDIVKIGFFGHERHEECIDALKPIINSGVRIVAVLFSDQHPNFDIVTQLSCAGFYGVMLDTQEKTKGHLLDHFTLMQLNDFIMSSRSVDLKVGLAGSLRIEHVEDLADLNPDFLGFRGALCEKNNRILDLDTNKLKAIKEVLHKCNNSVLEVDRC